MEEKEGETKGGSDTLTPRWTPTRAKLLPWSCTIFPPAWSNSHSSTSISRQSSRARSELRSQGTLSRIATPAAILLFSMMSRETPAIGISHRRIKCVLERGGQRVARRHSREASERSQGHVRPRKREGSTGVPAFPWKTHRTKIRPTYDWGYDFEIDGSSSKGRN